MFSRFFGGGKKDDANEEPEKPKRRKAPPAQPIPPEVQYADQLKQLRKRGFTDDAVNLEKLAIYGGDVNAVLMELDLDRTASSTQSPAKPEEAKKPPRGVDAAAEPDERPARKSRSQSGAPSQPSAKTEFSGNLSNCVASEIRQILLQVSPPEVGNAVERMYSQSVNGSRLYKLDPEAVSNFGFQSQEQFANILRDAENRGPPQVQTVSATDEDEKKMEAATESQFNVGDGVTSSLGHGTVTEFSAGDVVISQMGRSIVLEKRAGDGMIIIETPTGSKGYFHPSSLVKVADSDVETFLTGDIVMASMGRCKVLRTRLSDGMIVIETPTGSTGFFHPAQIKKLRSKFFLRDELKNIKSWTAATVREAILEVYPELAERLYAKSVNGQRLLGMEENEVLHLSGLGNNFNGELYDRVAATLGLHAAQQVTMHTSAKVGPVGDLASSRQWDQLKSRQENVINRLGHLDNQVKDLSGARGNAQSGPMTIPLSPSKGRGDPKLVALGQQQTETLGRLEDMMVELDRLTLTPQLFQLRQSQARTVKKLAGMLSSLPNGAQLVRQAEIEARKASFAYRDDEKQAEESGNTLEALARRQDAVYERLLAAGREIEKIAKQRNVKLPAFKPQPLPPLNIASSSLENLIVKGKPEEATEAKTNPATEPELYNPRGRGGAKKAPAGDLGRAVEAESKQMDSMLTIAFRLDKGKELQKIQIPLSDGQKSIAAAGVRNAVESALGVKVHQVRIGSKKKAKILADDHELNIGRKKRVEVNILTTDFVGAQ